MNYDRYKNLKEMIFGQSILNKFSNKFFLSLLIGQ